MAKKMTTVEVANAIRNDASQDYKSVVPVATETNLQDVGRVITSYTPLVNEFTGALVNKIGLQLYAQKMATNKLSGLKRGFLENASDIEQIYVAMAQKTTFDKDGTNPMGRRKPNIKTMYHKENYKAVYEVSISDEQVKQAFTSNSGINQLANQIINSLYSAASYDEFENMKTLIGSADAIGKNVVLAQPTDEATSRVFLKELRKQVAKMSYMSTEFNKQEVKTKSEKSEMIMLVLEDVLAEVDVEVLAKTFNLGKTDIEISIIGVDNFPGLENVYAVVLDRDAFMIYDTLQRMEVVRNPQGLFTNYFLHVWQLQSMSQFHNVLAFKTE